MSDDGTVPIRSYRNCFRLERRIHKIDRWRIPVPFGVPLRGVGYFAGVALAMLLLGRLPGLGVPIGRMSPELRYIVLPLAAAYALTRWEIDGRSAHAVGRSWLTMRLSPMRLVAWRPAPAQSRVTLDAVTIAPDDRGARPRRAVVEGPAHVLVRYPFKSRQRGRTLEISLQAAPPQWRGREIEIDAGRRVVIR